MNLTPGIFTNGISAGSGQSDEAAQLINSKIFPSNRQFAKGKRTLVTDFFHVSREVSKYHLFGWL